MNLDFFYSKYLIDASIVFRNMKNINAPDEAK